MKSENSQLKQLIAELALKNREFKKLTWLGKPAGKLMHYSSAEKREIIHIVEHSDLPVK